MFAKLSTKQKGGASVAFPDVCKTPAPPAPFVPIPYPNVEIASSGLKTASNKIQKFKVKFEKSKGDGAGTTKGLVTLINKISALFVIHSTTVKVTGKKASQFMSPNQTLKAFKQAQKQQKIFEKSLRGNVTR
ncbi:PAAR-like domain-containing protein [Tateyamaria sp.]|uniref:PAAR-like domain-containing protein n=1 Tax=Tateyamaria sp. TaxID=1929288 RepID=UPI0039B8BA6E